MSKIQKALQELRNKGERGRSGPSASRGTDTGTFPVKRQLSEGQRTATPSSSDVNAASQPLRQSELRPERHAAIDVDRLRESGLLAPANRSDLILSQFRRAKRPLVSCAFEIGIPIGANANIVAVASALPGAGKSFCAVNLAHGIALEKDVGAVLVDADVLKPNITKSLGMEGQPGLIDYLKDPTLDVSDVMVSTDFFDIKVIPAGNPDPESAELLTSRRMAGLVSSLSESSKDRVVIMDAPPLLATDEAHTLAGYAGQIVFVIEAGKSSQDSVMRALGTIDRQKPVNVILNKSSKASAAGLNGDDYGFYPYPMRNEGEG